MLDVDVEARVGSLHWGKVTGRSPTTAGATPCGSIHLQQKMGYVDVDRATSCWTRCNTRNSLGRTCINRIASHVRKLSNRVGPGAGFQKSPPPHPPPAPLLQGERERERDSAALFAMMGGGGDQITSVCTAVWTVGGSNGCAVWQRVLLGPSRQLPFLNVCALDTRHRQTHLSRRPPPRAPSLVHVSLATRRPSSHLLATRRVVVSPHHWTVPARSA